MAQSPSTSRLFVYVIVDYFGMYLEAFDEVTASYTSFLRLAKSFPTYNQAVTYMAQIPRPYQLRKSLCVVKRLSNLKKYSEKIMENIYVVVKSGRAIHTCTSLRLAKEKCKDLDGKAIIEYQPKYEALKLVAEPINLYLYGVNTGRFMTCPWSYFERNSKWITSYLN